MAPAVQKISLARSGVNRSGRPAAAAGPIWRWIDHIRAFLGKPSSFLPRRNPRSYRLGATAGERGIHARGASERFARASIARHSVGISTVPRSGGDSVSPCCGIYSARRVGQTGPAGIQRDGWLARAAPAAAQTTPIGGTLSWKCRQPVGCYRLGAVPEPETGEFRKTGECLLKPNPVQSMLIPIETKRAGRRRRR